MPAKTGAETVWDFRLAEVAKNLEENNFAVTVLPSLAAAVDYFKNSLLPEAAPKSVSVGGSESVTHSGVYQILEEGAFDFINPYAAGISPEENVERRRKGLLSDLYVTSSNALTRSGQLLNLDGGGNRVAALAFGPKKVVLFIGRNKICEDLDAGIDRIREFAAPANNIRLKRKNPCTKVGYCMDCKSQERICNVWALMAKCAPAKRIHILLINEDIGF